MDRQIEMTDGSVLLRPFNLTDANRHYEAVHESINELAVRMWWCHPNYSLDESRKWIESLAEAWQKGTYDFIMVDAETGIVLGSCSLKVVHQEFGIGEIGYWVRTTRSGNGIATAATNLLVQFGFKELNLNRIEIVIALDNAASQRVAEKVGAKREGVLRNRIVIHENAYDAVMFSLIPEDAVLTE